MNQEYNGSIGKLSGTCEFALGSIKEIEKKLRRLHAKMKDSNKPANEFEWDVEWIAKDASILHEIFTEHYERDGWFTQAERAEMAKRKKAEVVK